MNVPTELLRRILDRYRAQTVAVGGLGAGERFDADQDVAFARALLRAVEIEVAIVRPKEPEDDDL